MILIVDRTSKKQTLIKETLLKLFPGHKNYVVDSGAQPFDVLKHQQNVEMVIICEPTTSHNEPNQFLGKPSDHGVEWIEVLRHGGVWNTHPLKKLIIKPSTKEQLPILYLHPYSYINSSYYPSDFPSHFLIDKTTPSKAMKFTKKWYKSIGANEVVTYPWETEELKQAFLNCINKRAWHRTVIGPGSYFPPGEIPK